MKKAKKVAGLILFLGMGFVMFIMISYVLRPRIDGSNRKYFTGIYEAEKDSLDVVTLGSSAMYRYFNNPVLWEEYGLTSYNLATSDQPIEVLENLVDEVCKTQSPQLFVVETRQFLIPENDDGEIDQVALRRVTDNMNYSWNRVDLINKTIKDWPTRATYYFDIIYYHDNWELFDSKALDYVDNKDLHWLNGWRNVLTVNEVALPQNEGISERAKVSQTSEAVLRSFLEKCKKEEINVLFVATPWKISNQEMQQNNYIGDIIRESGFHFLDCNLVYDEIGLDPKTDFYNNRHTNVWGSQKFTRYVAQYIEDNYEMKVSHTDTVVEKWNKLLKSNERSLKRRITNQDSGEEDDIE